MSIRFMGVSKAFGEKVVLDRVSFEVQKGEIIFVIGKSGMGKSVTLKHMIGVLKPDQGQVWIDENEVTSATPRQLSHIRRKCGMVFQQPALFDFLTVFENIAFGLKTTQYLESVGRLHHPLSEKEIHSIVLEKAKLVHLPYEALNTHPSELSFGMQKRTSIARTLAPQPDYLLFDEPTTALDPIITRVINLLIQELSRELGVTSVVVSHDMRCALEIADRILVLDQGKILALGTPEEIKASKKELIVDFLAEALESQHA